MTILGAIFKTNNKDATKENVKPAREKLKSLRENVTYRQLSIIGQIILINSLVLSQIWHKAWKLNTKHQAIDRLISEIGSFLQTYKSNQILTFVSKNKKDGGLSLINIKKRIEATKIKLFSNLDKNIPETDDPIYALGNRTQKLFNKTYDGSTPEIYNSKQEKLIQTILTNINNIDLDNI